MHQKKYSQLHQLQATEFCNILHPSFCQYLIEIYNIFSSYLETRQLWSCADQMIDLTSQKYLVGHCSVVFRNAYSGLIFWFWFLKMQKKYRHSPTIPARTCKSIDLDHSLKDCDKILTLLGYKKEKNQYDTWPPVLYPNNKKNLRKPFRNAAPPLVWAILYSFHYYNLRNRSFELPYMGQVRLTQPVKASQR